MFGEINFGDLVKNSPIRQIKIPAKVSGYTVIGFGSVPDPAQFFHHLQHRIVEEDLEMVSHEHDVI